MTGWRGKFQGQLGAYLLVEIGRTSDIVQGGTDAPTEILENHVGWLSGFEAGEAVWGCVLLLSQGAAIE